jgi:hypothetical protein
VTAVTGPVLGPLPVRWHPGLGAAALLLVGLLFAWGVGPQCGGRLLVEPFCDVGSHLCEPMSEKPWCCGDTFACGTTANGCPLGDCCPLATEPDGSSASQDDPGGWQYVPPPNPAPPHPPASAIPPRPQ